MPLKDFEIYLQNLHDILQQESTEHSARYALENLLKSLAQEYNSRSGMNVSILHEPKRKENYGAPDFKIYTAHTVIGYVENKKMTEDLNKILHSEQIQKYRELSPNLILTNYLEFIWIKDENIYRETLCHLSDIQNKNFVLDTEKVQNIEKLLTDFFSQPPKHISQPHDLAVALAARCKNLKNFIQDELTRQSQLLENERLYDLYNAFKESVFEELTISEFSDAFAQMLTYGLFLAGLNAERNLISLENAKKYIPASFQLIKELIYFLDELEKPEYQPTKWILDEIIFIINHIEWAELTQNMSFSKTIKDSEGIETDPYLYFYETFLAEYDHNLRKARGVYYTPPQVVSFIIKSIDEILKSIFNLDNGFAEQDKVTVLDFATGTGTFLLEVFKATLENIPKQNTEMRKTLIQSHILQNFYGFEYLIAPYTVAHLKLSQFLKENGYTFQDKERIQVYLTNTLEPVDRQVKIPFMPQLSREAKSAQSIKDKPILVITGNPPYSGHSKNNTAWIKNQIRKYFFVDSKPLGEKNPKWLQDDYVKFLRFTENKMETTEQGIVAVITNHSFLDNPTFRGMRQSLLNTFDQLYFIDLHGNSKKKEKTPDGHKDQNVFDIQQGVCISFFIKKKGLKKGVFHTDFWGSRNNKFKLCTENSLQTLKFTEIKPNSPFYLFVPQNQKLRSKYEQFWSVKDIFEINSVGIVTARDNLAIHFTKESLKNTLQNFISISEKEARQKYALGADTRDWRVVWAQEDIKNSCIQDKNILRLDENKVKPLLYRPFDIRYTYYTGKENGFICRPRKAVMSHFDNENIAILTMRNSQGATAWSHVFVSCLYADLHVIPAGTYIFPLFRYNGNGNGSENEYLFKENGKKDNFTENFRKFIKTKYRTKFTVEQIFGYIYAILHSTKYRSQYTDFLKMDFPRIPFIEDEKVFEELACIGWELAQRHTFKKRFAFKELPELANYPIQGNNIVTQVEHKKVMIENKVHERLYINKEQYFEAVPQEVYEFEIGGYKVLEKYLKSRKEINITNDLLYIAEVIKVLYFTIQQSKEIDTRLANLL